MLDNCKSDRNMSTSPCQMVWASVLAFSCIIIMLAVLLSIPFCMARVPFINRLVGKLAQLMGVATPVPNTHVMKGASGKMLRQLRVSWYQTKVDPEDPEPDMCPICFCEYSPGVALIKLDCGHFFHKECIRKWLKRDATCPMCKTGLTDSGHNRLQQQLQQEGAPQQQAPEAPNATASQAVVVGSTGTAAASPPPPPSTAAAPAAAAAAAAAATPPVPEVVVVVQQQQQQHSSCSGSSPVAS